MRELCKPRLVANLPPFEPAPPAYHAPPAAAAPPDAAAPAAPAIDGDSEDGDDVEPPPANDGRRLSVVAREAALNAVIEEMHRIDRAMSPFKPDSELSRLNREAAKA